MNVGAPSIQMDARSIDESARVERFAEALAGLLWQAIRGGATR